MGGVFIIAIAPIVLLFMVLITLWNLYTTAILFLAFLCEIILVIAFFPMLLTALGGYAVLIGGFYKFRDTSLIKPMSTWLAQRCAEIDQEFAEALK